MIFFDTSVWIRFLRSSKKEQQTEYFQKNIFAPIVNLNVAINPIVMYELLQGARLEKHYEDIEMIKKSAKHSNVSSEVYEYAGQLSGKLLRKNKRLPMADILIASHCILQQHELISFDSHFLLIQTIDSSLQFTQLKVT